jgi:hypothetical protein
MEKPCQGREYIRCSRGTTPVPACRRAPQSGTLAYPTLFLGQLMIPASRITDDESGVLTLTFSRQVVGSSYCHSISWTDGRLLFQFAAPEGFSADPHLPARTVSRIAVGAASTYSFPSLPLWLGIFAMARTFRQDENFSVRLCHKIKRGSTTFCEARRRSLRSIAEARL